MRASGGQLVRPSIAAGTSSAVPTMSRPTIPSSVRSEALADRDGILDDEEVHHGWRESLREVMAALWAPAAPRAIGAG